MVVSAFSQFFDKEDYMLKLSQKKRNTCLAFAVAASILGGGSVFAAETADYTATLNGMRDPA